MLNVKNLIILLNKFIGQIKLFISQSPSKKTKGDLFEYHKIM